MSNDKDHFGFTPEQLKKFNNSFKYKARSLVANAIANGILVRPKKCSNCGRKKKHIDAHHEDYYKPLDVIWLCRNCHSIFDKARRKRLDGQA